MQDSEHFRLLVESATDFAIISLDKEGRYNSWNIGAERLLGFTTEEALGQPSALIFTPEDREDNVPQIEMLMAFTKGRAEDERWHLRKDNTRFWASGVMTPLYDDTGEFVGYAKIMRDLTERKQWEEQLGVVNEALRASQERLQQSNGQLERRVGERTAELKVAHDTRLQLLQRLVNAQEEERRRLSRELHDQMGQQITALSLGLTSIKTALSPDAMATLAQLQAISQDIAQEIHHISFALRPTALDDLGLVPALRNYVMQWSEWNKVPVEMELMGWEEHEAAAGEKHRLLSEVETTIYRIVQEAFTNITRHASAVTHVSLLLQLGPKEIRVIVEDNGTGFDVETSMNQPAEKRRLGLFGMQERALLVRGRLSIESEPGKGTSVFLTVPRTSSFGNIQ